MSRQDAILHSLIWCIISIVVSGIAFDFDKTGIAGAAGVIAFLFLAVSLLSYLSGED